MFDDITRMLHSNPSKLAREAFGLAALCVAILAGLILPALT